MIPKITKLRRKSDEFPEDRSDGDIVINLYNEMFVFAKKQWRLVGGRFIDSDHLNAIVQYLRTGWDQPSIIEADVKSLLEAGLNQPNPPKPKRYAPLAPLWYEIFVNNLVLVAGLLDNPLT